MCGIEYCGTCAPPSELVAWTEGRLHTVPTFGDYAQRQVARTKRVATFERTKREDPTAAKAFPEFLSEGEPAKYTAKFAEQMRPNFDRLVGELPGFAAFVKTEPRVALTCGLRGRARRKARTQALRWWKRCVISSYLQQAGGSLEMIHEIFGLTLPWWAQAETEQEPLRLAA